MRSVKEFTIFKKINNSGFTIVELMIATAVFSVILIICTVAVLYVTQLYIKGNVESQTQNTTRSIIQTIAQDIEFNNSYTFNFNTGGNFFCIGQHVYTYALNKEVTSSSSPAFVLSTQSTCPSVAPSLNVPISGSSAELLSKHMRLGQVSIQHIGPTSTPTYKISISIAYGSSSILNITPNGGYPPTSYTYSCPPEALGGQFCAVSTLTTVVTSRIQ